MAKCHPQKLEETSKINGYWEIHATLLNAIWIGSFMAFGHPKPIQLWSSEDMLPEVTPVGLAWMNWSEPHVITTPVGTAQDIFEEGPKGIHDPLQSCKKKLQLSDTSSAATWEQSIKEAIEEETRSPAQTQLIALAIRLSKSPPECLPGWNKGNLPVSMIGSLWKGATQIFGNMRTTKMGEKMEHSVTFSEILKKKPISVLKRPTKSPQNPPIEVDQSILAKKQGSNFIVRSSAAPKVPKKDHKKTAYNNHTLMQVILPVFIGDVSEYSAALKTVMAYLKNLWSTFMSCEPYSTAILNWGTYLKVPPIKSAIAIPTTKLGLEGKYVDTIQMAWSPATSQGTAIRFILGHSRPIQYYMDH